MATTEMRASNLSGYVHRRCRPDRPLARDLVPRHRRGRRPPMPENADAAPACKQDQVGRGGVAVQGTFHACVPSGA